MEEYYTPEQIAKKLQITTQTVWRWIRTKRLKAVRIGKSYRVPVQDFNEFINKGKTV
ncbi:helix-turn-helix domain-containing protein [Candidatus Gottesmanbacteria bacterium]|nr:helix-turn-helix domain-containing protein [Candidatus Gottesmanbacteria bacterium]